MRKTVVALSLCLFSLLCHATEKIPVKIIQRQINDNGYSNFVPGHAYSTANGSANCNSSGSNVNCNASATGYTTYTAPHEVSYSVTGATFMLLLADGRRAIVNCVSKYSPKGDYINRRSCRMPLVDSIDAEFKGNSAKLYWVVSLDGKKLESETYKILAILEPEAAEQPKP